MSPYWLTLSHALDREMIPFAAVESGGSSDRNSSPGEKVAHLTGAAVSPLNQPGSSGFLSSIPQSLDNGRTQLPEADRAAVSGPFIHETSNTAEARHDHA